MNNNSLETLPVIPLADTVIFPGITSPVVSIREISKIAVKEAVSKYNRKVVVATQKSPEMESVDPGNLYEIGVLSEILIVSSLNDDVVRCNIKGIRAVQIDSFLPKNNTLYAYYKEVKDEIEEDSINDALKNQLLDIYREYVWKNPRMPKEILNSVENSLDSKGMINFVASNSFLPVESKIKLLRISALKKRFFTLIEMLKTEIELLSLQAKINEQVKSKFEKSQREFFLNEQLKIIRKELGKEEDERIHKLKGQFENKELPKKIKQRVEEEIERLKKIPTISPEFGVIYNYVEWLLRLPWEESSSKALDLNRTKQILEKNHYGLEDIKERVLEYLSVLKLREGCVGQILCFIGPPGVGKTSLGRSIAEALRRPFVRTSLGGIRDEAEIRGHRRTYVGSMPGKVIQKMANAGVKNPVFLLDEIDKIGQDFRGDPASALLEVLDPEVNYDFNDHYIEEGFDLSKVLFITTANTTHSIPPTLLDRMEIISLPGYLEYEKIKIATRHLIPKVIENNGLQKNQFTISEGVLYKLVEEYSNEAGVRELERLLSRLAQKTAKKIVFEGDKRVRITKRNLQKYLGAPKFKKHRKHQKEHIGVANGLAVTRNGGKFIQVEARTMEGSGELILTGQMGEVMQESAKTALSLIRSNHKSYNLDRNCYKDIDLHIHIPEGAVPKDGPSAGITIYSAILSALTQRPLKDELAMTGEITLSGDILRIGGLREKLVAAQRASLTTVILPKENRAETDYFPDATKKGLKLLFVENVTEIVGHIFSK
ncbi:endopeptidase La [candidate division WOR-3 bacterium]|nr:endopeptidase La [candidate division WOR-3 bacterium]MCK4527609.1 endopeptidase La [candidate division WOR-3 bacterium]